MDVISQHFGKNIFEINSANIRAIGDENILLLKSNVYLADVLLETGGYDFTLTTTAPPTALVGKREYQFHKGSLISLEPGVGIIAKHSPPTSEFTAICIRKGFFQNIAQEASGKSEITFRNIESSYSPQLLSIIQQYVNEINNNNTSCPLMTQSIAVQMVIQLLRDTYNNSRLTNVKAGQSDNHIGRALEYMQTFFNAGINIADICREVNLSPYYFIRLFKNQTGKTPHEYLLCIRLEKAAQLLREGSYSIEEIARFCGFVNLGHFSTVFRCKMGVTPSTYRKNYHE